MAQDTRRKSLEFKDWTHGLALFKSFEAEDVKLRIIHWAGSGEIALIASKEDGVVIQHGSKRMIVAVENHDAKHWVHLSISKPKFETPTYWDLKWMHENILGPDRIAYQCFVPLAEYVNEHPGVLHLYSPSGFRPTPDFRGTREDGSKGI